MARIVMTRKTSGGRTCFFKGKGGRMTTSRGKSGSKPPTGAQREGVKETMNQTHTPSPKAPIAMMESRSTPSNYKMTQTKVNHDNLVKKLSSMKLSKPKNISFDV